MTTPAPPVSPAPATRRAPQGLVARVFASWWAPRRVYRSLADMSEPSMLAVLLGAMGLFFLAQIPGHRRAAILDPSIPMDARLGGAIVGVMCLMPLLAYAVAALAALTSRGRLSAPDSRLALFWALLAVAPAMLLEGITQGYLGDAPGLRLVQAIAGLGFLWIWFSGVSALWRR